MKSNELGPSSLGFMTPEAFHYYFPAYLLASLEEDSGDVIDDVLHHLEAPEVAERHRKNYDRFTGFQRPSMWSDEAADFQTKYGGFTPDQKEAARNFLIFILDELIAYNQETNESISIEEMELRSSLDYWNNF